MTSEVQIVAICQEFGWDYYQYMAQPKWFIEILKDKLEIDAEKSKQANKK